ncbi:MAG: HAD-IC family P-type ATPase [Leptolyngbyaceae cyanobacterium MO_188.B28]|nr:HAD-IC family P-type ATPase [Leptolyngbyaceae cyanobacterium MO_188.B28]
MTVLPNELWHDLSTAEVIALLETNLEQGLHSLEVQRRQRHYGPNALTQKKGKGPVIIFLEQFNQPLIYILLAAAAITGLLREWVDMTVILAVILINAVVGFLQESKAVKVMEALARAMPSKATIIREGKKQQILATELTPGDIVCLQSGDRVPADLRLLNCRNLQIDESALTGESFPVDKQPIKQLPLNTPLADRCNMAYSSTLVTYGVGTGAVVAIGDRTEIGRIKEMVVSAEILATPLTRQIEHFSLVLTKGHLEKFKLHSSGQPLRIFF